MTTSTRATGRTSCARSRLCLARIGPRRQDWPRCDRQIAARDSPRVGPADPHGRGDRRQSDEQMGELWPARIGQAYLERTGDPMSEANKDAGVALDLLQDLIARARRAGADAA